MWQMLRVYGVGEKLMKAVQSFYVESRAYVLVGNDVSESFPIDVGLSQGCAMSPWLFNIIYHNFLPPPRRGSHVKSDNTHTVIQIHPLVHILDT